MRTNRNFKEQIMLLEPPIDNLVAKAGNPYKLAVLVGKRAAELYNTLSEEEKEKKPVVSKAIEEFHNGKIIEKK